MSGYFDPQLAFIDHLDGSFLFDSMYSEDVEGNKLSYLPGVGELLEAYPFWATAASQLALGKFILLCTSVSPSFM